MAEQKISGAIRFGGKVYRAGQEKEFAEAASKAKLDTARLQQKGVISGGTASPKSADEGSAALADVELTEAARARATEAGLTAEDFKRKRASGATGFTVEDVERIAEAKAKG